MRLSCLLSGLCAMALLAACSTGMQPSVAAKPSSSPSVAASAPATSAHGTSPSPVASASPSPFVVPRPTVPFVRCDTPDLEMQLVNVGVAMGNVGGFIEVRNKSSHNCDLYGYAGIQLLDAQGRPLPTTALWSTDSYIHGHVNEIVVGLPAGTAGLTSDRQVPGHGYIPLSWSDVQKPCSVASKLRVIPPDLRHRVAAELFHERVGKRERAHRLPDDAGGRHHAHIAALVVRLHLFLGVQVDGG